MLTMSVTHMCRRFMGSFPGTNRSVWQVDTRRGNLLGSYKSLRIGKADQIGVL